MKNKRILTGAVLAALGVFAVVAGAQSKEGGGPRRDCFFVSQWRGWSAPTPDMLYLKVGLHDVYRVDLVGKTHSLRSPGNFLISEVRGSNSICSALDLDLYVADIHGFRSPLLPRAMTKLTPEEIAAIPRKDRP